MIDALHLSIPEPGGSAFERDFLGVAEAARAADGVDPFNEQARLDAASGARRAFLGSIEAGDGRRPVAAAVLGAGELDLVVAPDRRGQGVAGRMLESLLGHVDEAVTLWSHGDHPAARALAKRHGFAPVRTLLRLRAPLADRDRAPREGDGAETDVALGAFRPGEDDAEWLALNARIFAEHPEQGGVDAEDLRARRAEPWFCADDFLVARDRHGRMLGYDWLKVEPGEAEAGGEGEIYVLGVDPDAAGRGLGGRLLDAGLARLAGHGLTAAVLYVEGDNEPALRLYRRAGFVDDVVDVQYRREP